MKRITVILVLVIALVTAARHLVFAQAAEVQQVTFQLENGGFIVIDIVLPEGIRSVGASSLEYDASGRVIADSRQIGVPSLNTSSSALTAATPVPTRTPVPPPTPTQDGRSTATVNRDSNLRGGPGTNYNIASFATSGSTVEIVGSNSDRTWYNLSTGHWIAAFLLSPHGQINVPAVAAPAPPPANCDPSYPTLCIPPNSPDLDCRDIQARRFTVLEPDPHRFDGDNDGIGCER